MTARPGRKRPVRRTPRKRASPPGPLAPSGKAPRSGDACPRCGVGVLDYNGLLDLACEKCGYLAGGAGGGCT